MKICCMILLIHVNLLRRGDSICLYKRMSLFLRQVCWKVFKSNMHDGYNLLSDGFIKRSKACVCAYISIYAYTHTHTHTHMYVCKEYDKAVYCHPANLTSAQSILCKIPDCLTCLLRNMFAGQEATELDMEQQTGSK